MLGLQAPVVEAKAVPGEEEEDVVRGRQAAQARIGWVGACTTVARPAAVSQLGPGGTPQHRPLRA